MVTWAIEFENFYREQGRDENELETRTSEVFQYFYELDAGVGDDKLARRFEDDEAFRAIVFDLLFDGKIKNFQQVRELRKVYDTPEALEQLKEAHAQPNMAIGREGVSDAIFTAKRKSQENRLVGKGSELAAIAKWLREDVTLSVLGKLDANVLKDFRDAARAVDGDDDDGHRQPAGCTDDGEHRDHCGGLSVRSPTALCPAAWWRPLWSSASTTGRIGLGAVRRDGAGLVAPARALGWLLESGEADALNVRLDASAARSLDVRQRAATVHEGYRQHVSS